MWKLLIIIKPVFVWSITFCMLSFACRRTYLFSSRCVYRLCSNIIILVSSGNCFEWFIFFAKFDRTPTVSECIKRPHGWSHSLHDQLSLQCNVLCSSNKRHSVALCKSFSLMLVMPKKFEAILEKSRLKQSPFYSFWDGLYSGNCFEEFKIFAEFDKTPCFFSEMASKVLLALLTLVKNYYKMQQNDVSLSCIGRCIAEIIDQEVGPPWGRLLEVSV